MVARTLWLWLYVGWLMTWLSEAITNPSTTSVCDLGPCQCNKGRLICDCSTSVAQEVTLKNDLFDSYSFSLISVSNCLHVHVASEAFVSLTALQQVSISNIERLTLDEKSFRYTTNNPQHSGLLVNISNCAIPEIPSYCFRGSLRDIILSSVNVSRVQAFAFSSIDHAEKIEFSQVDFAHLETQSFKKFRVDFFTFSDCYVVMFPKRTMLEIEVVQEARFTKVRVDRIATTAFAIRDARNFRLIQSIIGYTEQRAFNVITRGDVSIHDNRFSLVEKDAFVGFTVENKYLQEAGKQDLVFENNTLVDFENAALTFNTSGFNPRLDWIMINQSCSCSRADSWATDVVYFTSDSSSKTTAPQVSTVMYCLNTKAINVKEFQRLYCNVTKSSILVRVLIVVGVVIVIVLCIVGIVIYCAFKKKGKRYINVPTSPSARKPADGTKSSHMLVVPDGKTYRETELHVIVEHAQPIISTEYVKERPDQNGND